MTPPVPVEDTYAVVVGIERYEIGHDWNRLTSVALDACAFAEWLRVRGVPPDHIVVITSALPESEDDVERRVKAHGFRHRQADSHTIVEVLTRELPDVRGGLLWVYWCGHGVTDDHWRRRLFFADARDNDKRNLDVDSMLRAFRSDFVPGFDRQIFLIDACQTFASAIGEMSLSPGHRLPSGVPLADRDQFVLFATSPGRRAVHSAALPGGLFSSVLLDVLRDEPRESWPPDMDEVWKKVESRLSHGHSSAPRPTRIWFRARDGSEDFWLNSSIGLIRPPSSPTAITGTSGDLSILGRSLAAESADGPVETLDDYRLRVVSRWLRDDDPRFIRDLVRLIPDAADQAFALPPPTSNVVATDLPALLSSREDKIIMLLGEAGAGKTTLLRHLHATAAFEELRQPQRRNTLFVRLRDFDGEASQGVSSREWLGRQWARQHPRLPDFESLVSAAPLLLICDGLNELPHRTASERYEIARRWKDLVHEVIGLRQGNRVVLSCRTRDYDIVLGTDEEPCLHVEIQRIDADRAAALLPESPQLVSMARTPFMLGLLRRLGSDRRAAPRDRAQLLTDLVAQSLRRELSKDNQRLRPGEGLLTEDDLRLLARPRPYDGYSLPDEGALVEGLEHLAFELHKGTLDGARASVPRRSVEKLFAGRSVAPGTVKLILQVGFDLNLLAEDGPADRIGYSHELFREYFAARVLARESYTDMVAWSPPHDDPSSFDSVPLPLPALPGNRWESPALLATLMREDREEMIHRLADVNLLLAARCATEPGMSVSDALRSRLTRKLFDLMTQAGVDIRVRMEAGLLLGQVGDPRLRRATGPHGPYIQPHLVPVPDGLHYIGSDLGEDDTAPLHRIRLDRFEIGRYAVTNAQFACFIESGGYQDDRWWYTPAMRSWREGVGTAYGYRAQVRYWWNRLDAAAVHAMFEEGIGTEREAEVFLAILATPAERLPETLLATYPDMPYEQPEFWGDQNYNNPNQPVIGVSQYEAKAYCAWLSAQAGRRYRLPSEVQWEAAARCGSTRLHPCPDHRARHHANLSTTRLRRPSPIGMFQEGRNEWGLYDLCGNTSDRTRSAYGEVGDDVGEIFRYPYISDDGREDENRPFTDWAVTRGSNWRDRRALTYRIASHPTVRAEVTGFRVCHDQP